MKKMVVPWKGEQRKIQDDKMCEPPAQNHGIPSDFERLSAHTAEFRAT